jgi:ComF family protein
MASTGKSVNLLKKIWQNILDYVFPVACFGCGVEEEDYLCSSCFNKIIYLADFPCLLCNSGNYPLGICPVCSKESAIDRIFVATSYNENIVGRLVEELKYNYLESTVAGLAKIVDHAITQKKTQDIFTKIVFVPIPLHRKRFADRGFNQSELLARALAIKYNSEVSVDLLKRTKSTNQQAKLNRQQRIENVNDAFCLNLDATVPEKVILVDDVLTTGTTFREATKKLKAGGVREVICLAICHG